MRFRDGPLLVDGIDADLYVERPDLERRLLDPVDINGLFELFGRLREEVWALPHQWVVEVSSEQSGALRQPPADAFFSAVFEIPPLDEQEIEQLLRRGLEEDEARVVLQQPKRPLMDYPRDVVRYARSTLGGTLEGEQNAARRREVIAAGLGRTAHMALAEIEARGAPVGFRPVGANALLRA
jgi:hypothetical protein